MKLNRTDAFWDRKTRNDLNENWDIIEGNTRKLEDDFKNVVNNITDDVVEQLVDNAKLNWKEPVPSQNNLPGNAQVGDTRMTRDTGKVYRFNGSAWVEIQQIDAGPVNEVDSRLTAQLAETTEDIEQRGINVKVKYDAKGDGTDDTTAIQSALDDASPYSTIFLPAGRYSVSSLTIPKNKLGLTIMGLSKESTTISFSNQKAVSLLSGYITFRDIEIKGNESEKSLLFSDDRTEGTADFDINLIDCFVIVKSSTILVCC